MGATLYSINISGDRYVTRFDTNAVADTIYTAYPIGCDWPDLLSSLPVFDLSTTVSFLEKNDVFVIPNKVISPVAYRAARDTGDTRPIFDEMATAVEMGMARKLGVAEVLNNVSRRICYDDVEENVITVTRTLLQDPVSSTLSSFFGDGFSDSLIIAGSLSAILRELGDLGNYSKNNRFDIDQAVDDLLNGFDIASVRRDNIDTLVKTNFVVACAIDCTLSLVNTSIDDPELPSLVRAATAFMIVHAATVFGINTYSLVDSVLRTLAVCRYRSSISALSEKLKTLPATVNQLVASLQEKMK